MRRPRPLAFGLQQTEEKLLFNRKIFSAVSLAGVLMFSSLQPALADCTDDCWGALAAGLWRDYDGVARVSVGSAINHPSRALAQAAALDQCYARGQNCEVVGDFSNGACGYITTGSSYEGVVWTSGTTSARAYNKCIAEGYSCQTPIGGCAAD